MKRTCLRCGLTIILACMAGIADAQPPQGFGGPGGSGGFSPFGPREDVKLLKEYDKDENGWLDRQERVPAREAAKSEASDRRGAGPFGGRRGPGPGPFGGRGEREPAQPGRHITPAEVATYPDASLYDPTVLRTLFFEFENEDWEQELEDFHGTDVDVPATLTVDGKSYENVGMRFRGMSSYGMVPTGYKRSFNVSLDMADEDQLLDGYKTLNLLNSAGDPSFMSTVLYSYIANQYIPAPKANHVRVVINGEDWGVYVNVQQFDKIFLSENFESSRGTRWKVSGNPGADGGLRYLGEDLDEYKQRFEMKSNDGKKAWGALVELCRTLNETPLDELESALEPMLDIDETLRFLALDVALVNSDGYWTRASDYSLFRDSDKRFHVIPHDMNEAFHSGRGRGPGGFGPPGFGPGGPGGFGPPGFGPGGFGPPDEEGRPRRPDSADDRGPRAAGERPQPDQEPSRRRGDDQPQRDRGPGGPGPDRFGRGGAGPDGPDGERRGRGGFGGPGGFGFPGHGGVDLDPLVSIDNPRMPLRSRLLAVPKLREKYLQYVHEIAEKSLDWKSIEPVIARQRKLIESEVASDTRKLETLEAFQQATSLEATGDEEGRDSLRTFFEKRREFLLDYKEPRGNESGSDGRTNSRQ